MLKSVPISAFLFAFLCGSIHGQLPANQSSQTESLLIGPGDMLHIQVCDTPQFDQHAQVDDEGQIRLLYLGNIHVAGETPGQAAVTISSKFLSEGLMLHPQVGVSIEHYATQDVSVLGQVDKPGSYPIGTPRSVFVVLSMAGGLNSVADRHIIVRRRGNLGVQQTFLVANAPRAGIANDLEVFPGDTIIVPKVSLVYILGDVGRPGGYPLAGNDTNMTLLGILAEAGSANKTAALSNAKLLRKSAEGYTVTPLNVGAIQVGKAQSPALEPDDILFVPFSYAKNLVLNAAAMATAASSAALFIP
jgi:polysaccharide export outer membrane protein